MIYSKNSEILFIYDAQMTNPNGDPDDENKPRMDYEKEVNLVSDVRLKRYIRDYLESKGYEIFITKVEGETVNATERLEKLLNKEKLKNLSKEDIDKVLEKLIDVRLFGATMPLKAQEGEKGASSTFTGPVQFTWGYSLNKVELVTSSSITSTFSGRDQGGKGEYGTIGKDWRLYYSLIAFYGIVSGYRAQYTRLSEDDVKLLDEALIQAIPQMASTRSKIGQKPRLLLRVEYKDSNTFLGDMRGKILLDKEEGLRDIKDFELDLSNLVRFLEENQRNIEKIYLFEDVELRIKDGSLFEQLQKSFNSKIEKLA
ncbi:MAG: type I-B CRISPR-associated protein Cas7/Csh2 [Dictyoglomaceae bacterium]|nr:type I-B CRISPR-associated protein Cas7/Csh2 [Dictyoglomaceae bacterium]HPU44084.1 type I-B CRISPR-associated protein Cas7/Csh2 [Dictyoglomaceae bacterium]